MLLTAYEDDEHLPEYATLVVHDVRPTDWTPSDPPDEEGFDPGWALEETALEIHFGSVALAGGGWVKASTSGDHQRVRLEAHDSAPPLGVQGWDRVWESPYLSPFGGVGLSGVTSFAEEQELRLTGAHEQRLRISVRPAPDEGEVWLLQYWPASLTMPRAVRRLDDPEVTELAGDVLNLVAWAVRLSGQATPLLAVAELADLLLVETGAVRLALESAVEEGHLRLTGDVHGRAPLLIEPLEADWSSSGGATMDEHVEPGPPWGSGPGSDELAGEAWGVDRDVTVLPDGTHVHVDSTRTGEDQVLELGMWVWQDPEDPTHSYRPYAGDDDADEDDEQPERFVPPVGRPPDHGVVTESGVLLMWRDGRPVEAARLRRRPMFAERTARGVLLSGGEQGVHAGDDGRNIALPPETESVQPSPDGRWLAAVQTHYGRKSWSRLHLLDLETGRLRSEPWEESELAPRVSSVTDDGIVTLAVERHSPTGSAESWFTWRPGGDVAAAPAPPRPAPAVGGGDDHTIVDLPGRRPIRLPAGEVSFSPQMVWAVSFGRRPPSVQVYDLSVQDPGNSARTYWLEAEAEADAYGPWAPVWETEHELLVRDREGWSTGVPMLRLDVTTGRFEAVPLPEEAWHDPLPVTPMRVRGR